MTPPKERRRATDVEVEGPFGTRIKFYGKQLSFILLLAALAVGVGYLISQHDSRAADAMAKIQANQIALAEHMDEMIYVMSLTEAERARLRISMPESLRKKMHDR